MEVLLHSFLNSALDEGKRSTSHLCSFTSGKELRRPLNRTLDVSHWVWVIGRKVSCLYRSKNSGFSSPHRSHHTDYAIPTPIVNASRKVVFYDVWFYNILYNIRIFLIIKYLRVYCALGLRELRYF